MPLKPGQPRVFRMLAVWMILCVGLFLDTATGLNCYKCEGPECKANFRNAENEVDCKHGYCETVSEGDTVKRQCSPSAKEGECINKEFPGHCYTFSDGDKTKLTSCMTKGSTADGEGATAAGGEGKVLEKPGVNICACDSPLCNNGDGSSGNKATNADARKNESPSSGSGEAASENGTKCYECGPQKEGFNFMCSTPEKDIAKKCPNQYCTKWVNVDTGETAKQCLDLGSEAKDAHYAAYYYCYNRHGSNGCIEHANKKAYSCLKAELRKERVCICKGNLCNFGEQLISKKVLIFFLAILWALLFSYRRKHLSVSF